MQGKVCILEVVLSAASAAAHMLLMLPVDLQLNTNELVSGVACTELESHRR